MKHRVTHERFLMKIISNEAPDQIKLQFKAELLALQVCNRNEGIIKLVDCFTNASGCIYMVTQLPQLSLRDYVQSLSFESFHVETVALLIRKLGLVLEKLHQKKVIHRDIRADNISVKVSSKVDASYNSKENIAPQTASSIKV